MSSVLSQRLREWRKVKELSQEKLGEIVSAKAGRPVAQTVIASYENRGRPTAWFLAALADAFDDLDMNKLLRDETKDLGRWASRPLYSVCARDRGGAHDGGFADRFRRSLG